MRFTFHDTPITVNMPRHAALETEVARRFRQGDGFALATVNLDHLVKMTESPAFTRAYAAQDLVVADGWPVVALAHLARQPVELMPGSDLVLPLCRLAADAGAGVALVGSTGATLDNAATALRDKVPGLEIVLTVSPPMGFDPESAEADAIFARLNDSGARLCLLALGAPKQETMAARGRHAAPGIGFASIGAGLDFLGGQQKRAPRLMRRAGLEWLWRALSSPRRLGPRYARCIAILPGRVADALRQRWG
ncbi:MAG: WecB/TagA/CpsF family glycosyltransferase [Roseovarius sp.]|nr:WecB/TagA/CpsF family glycosyltransferase [Roseovarius sp.]